jgi:hypothetical protein
MKKKREVRNSNTEKNKYHEINNQIGGKRKIGASLSLLRRPKLK